jgi:hypothetical protein
MTAPPCYIPFAYIFGRIPHTSYTEAFADEQYAASIILWPLTAAASGTSASVSVIIEFEKDRSSFA